MSCLVADSSLNGHRFFIMSLRYLVFCPFMLKTLIFLKRCECIGHGVLPDIAGVFRKIG